MGQKIIFSLTAKIEEEYGMNTIAAFEKAKSVMKNCPEVLMKNIREWVNDIPLTDIYVSKYSISMILALWNSTDFLKALEVMKNLSEGYTEKAELKIWEMRR